ncbi:hypothetical protein BS78_10G206300 [Paspalum vaginatum]|nr:hypothetical protein BS78_10G206300 [Paspalum vaginatum]
MKVLKKELSQEQIEAKLAMPIDYLETPEDEDSVRYFDYRNAMADYDKALIDQYNAQGHAKDETEVTDDEYETDGPERKEARKSEAFYILKKKKVFMGYMAVMGADIPNFNLSKKRVKVVKKRLPKRVIKVMMEKPFDHMEVSEEHLRHRSLQSRIYCNWKNAVADYEKALIRQYRAYGYAEDESEVTDEED